jgi:hypothetical protein
MLSSVPFGYPWPRPRPSPSDSQGSQLRSSPRSELRRVPTQKAAERAARGEAPAARLIGSRIAHVVHAQAARQRDPIRHALVDPVSSHAEPFGRAGRLPWTRCFVHGDVNGRSGLPRCAPVCFRHDEATATGHHRRSRSVACKGLDSLPLLCELTVEPLGHRATTRRGTPSCEQQGPPAGRCPSVLAGGRPLGRPLGRPCGTEVHTQPTALAHHGRPHCWVASPAALSALHSTTSFLTAAMLV